MTTFSPGTSTLSLNTSCATMALSPPSIESTNGLDPIATMSASGLISSSIFLVTTVFKCTSIPDS